MRRISDQPKNCSAQREDRYVCGAHVSRPFYSLRALQSGCILCTCGWRLSRHVQHCKTQDAKRQQCSVRRRINGSLAWFLVWNAQQASAHDTSATPMDSCDQSASQRTKNRHISRSGLLHRQGRLPSLTRVQHGMTEYHHSKPPKPGHAEAKIQVK